MIVLQHRREAKRALNSGSLLSVCVDSERLTTVVARSLAPLWHNERIAAALRRQEHEHLSLLVLFPAPGAISLQAAQRRVEHGERFALVVIDGTWQEAREMFAAKYEGRREAGTAFECLALAPEDLEFLQQGAPSFAGCRKPEGPDCLCTLEAVALALRALEPNAERGAALANDLLGPLSHMVAHQTIRTDGREVHRVDRPRYVPGLSERARKAAEAVDI